MSEHLSNPAAREAIERFESGLADIRARADAAKAALYDATGSAASTDGAVRVGVDAAGAMTELVFGAAARDMAADRLAQLVLAVARRAQLDALRRAREAVAAAMGESGPAVAVLDRDIAGLQPRADNPDAGFTGR